jgi:hypothetical protein
MRSNTCRTTRRDLEAYRDGELPMDRQLLVRAHLAACAECLSETEAVDRLGGVIRHSSSARVDSMRETLGSVHARVMARVQADPPSTLGRRAARAFDAQGHWLWAAAGATFATIVCVLSALGVMRLSLREEPLSMAAVIGAMADPGSNRNPLALHDRLLLPRAFPIEIMPATLAARDELVALKAVVTREGDLRNLELLGRGPMQAWEVEQLLEVVELAGRSRFEPAREGRTPVAVNVVWLLAHTTVVGKDRDLQMPPGVRHLRDLPTLRAPRASVPMSSTGQARGRILV